MILIGQYDSPFVRRVGIALRVSGRDFEHQPWSTFGDADKIRPFSPLLRVPVLVVGDGSALIDSHMMLDYLDGLDPQRALFPRNEPGRSKSLRIAALACGIADKAVSLFYEKVLHSEVSALYVARCTAQIRDTLQVLEQERAALTTPFWFGEHFGHADIVVATMWRHLHEAHPGLVAAEAFPALALHCAGLEERAVFREISQVFIPPR